MASEKHDLAATRERLEFLLEKDGGSPHSPGRPPSPGSTRQAFLAGAAFSGLIAGSIFLTSVIDSKLHESEATSPAISGVTNGTLGSANGIKSIAAGSPGLVDSRLVSFGSERSKPRDWQNAPVLNGAPNLGPTTSVTRGMPPRELGDTLPSSVATATPQENTQINQPLAPISGLSTSRSVITGVADPRTMTASYYWTFTLKNQTKSSKEAQMNIALPNGAVVSRATLWINGRAEEAAFNTTSQVQNAYDWIVTHNRDPLLITQTEDGNINLKASPVMPNKEMKIRIGITTPMQMTADGRTQMDLPHIIDANLDFHCIQNVHITSETPLVSNDTRMNSPAQKHGYLLRGNVNSDDLQKLQVSAQRDPNMARFATRATHSNPPSYIVAELQQDDQGLRSLNLTKSVTLPDCPILKDDHAAFRLSYLWVKKEIERLARAQDIFQAEELATVYRVVSPVSGAVVLERQTDYDYNGLDRNLYKSLAYEPRQDQEDSLAQNYGEAYSSQQPAREFPRAMPKPSAAPSAVSAPAPMASFDKIGGIGGNLAYEAPSRIVTRHRSEHNSTEVGIRDSRSRSNPITETKNIEKANSFLANKAQKSQVGGLIPRDDMKADATSMTTESDPSAVGSYSEQGYFPPLLSNGTHTLSNKDSTIALSNSTQSLSNQDDSQAVRLTGPAGLKLESWAKDANMMFLSHPISTAALLALLALTFGGAFSLYAIAALRLYRRQSGALKVATCGAIWVVIAAFSPLFSQVFTVLLAACLTVRAALKALKPGA